MRFIFILGALLVSVSFSGCLVGPRYRRPLVTAPDVYRDSVPTANPLPDTHSSMGDQQWTAVFKDEQLKALIGEALENNFDLKIAAHRLLEQEAQVGILRAQSLPSASGGGAYSAIGIPENALGAGSASEFHGGGLTAAAAWNLDFWGLYRRQTEAGRAMLLATAWGRKATRGAVVKGVASSYIRLQNVDTQLELMQKMLVARQEVLRLVSLRERVGTATMLDVHQAQQAVRETQASMPALESQIHQEENHLSFLLGREPGPIARGKRSALMAELEALPPGLPLELLERRPDLLEADAKLRAANARIGVAKAEFFPQISITGLGGTATSQFDKLLTTDSRYWFGAITVRQPLFTAGKLKQNLRLAQETQKEAETGYRKAFLSALQDVSNGLIASHKSRASRRAQEAVIFEVSELLRLDKVRFESGRTGYLEVLSGELALYKEEMILASYRQQEALSLVELYSALGGGWKQ